MTDTDLPFFRYFFVVEYDGFAFCGWQRQKDLLSAQACFEDAVGKATGQRQASYAAGRTDAGVHAAAQVVQVDFEEAFPIDRLKRGTNFYLKNKSLVVRDVFSVPSDQHARFSATARHYTYLLLSQSYPPVLSRGRLWWTPRVLCWEAMQRGANLFVGTHDFSALRAAECQAKSPIKTIDVFEVERAGPLFIFRVSARSFLHHQVRLMVGTLFKIGAGRYGSSHVTRLLEDKDKRHTGPLAPAEGLYFTGVSYGDKIISSMPKMTF
jgi:tRNA pseudouridine38-40 synthase